MVLWWYHGEERESVGDGEEEEDHGKEERHSQQLDEALHSKERTHLELTRRGDTNLGKNILNN